MPLSLTPIDYADLNARQKENYNFLKASAVLADYGFMTLRLTDDWQSADFIAQHIDGVTFLKVQLKGRLSFSKKYRGKQIYVMFFAAPHSYLYPHDLVLAEVLAKTTIGKTVSWSKRGGYSFPSMSKQMRQILGPYKVECLESNATG